MENREKLSPWKIVAALLTLACFLAALYGLNRPHLNPFRTSLETKYPTFVSASDAGTVLLDSQGSRMLILNKDGRLKTVTDVTLSGSPLDKLTAVFMYADRIFVTGACHFNNGVYVSSESVVEYDMQGKPVRTVYTQNYSEDDRINCPLFCHLTVKDDEVFLTIAEERELSVLRIGTEQKELGRWTLPEAIYLAGYSVPANACVITGISQACYRVHCDTGEIEAIRFGDYLQTVLDMFGIGDTGFDVSLLSEIYCLPSLVLNSDGTARYYCIVDPESQTMYMLSNDGVFSRDIKDIPYSFPLLLKTWGYWFSIAVLAIEALLLIIWLLIKKLTPKAKILLLFFGVVLFISIFYTGQMADDLVSGYNSSLVVQTKQIGYYLSKEYGELFRKIGEKDIYDYCTDLANKDVIAGIHDELKTLCDANDSEQACYALCFISDADGELYTFSDNCYSDMAGMRMYADTYTLFEAEMAGNGPIEKETSSASLVYDYAYITSPEGDVVGVLCIAALRDNLKYMQTRKTINTTVGLVALLIGGYMLVRVTRTIYEDIRRRKERPVSDTVGRSLDMAGILAFVRGIISGLDAVIIVYVAKSLCESLSPGMQALMAALPMTAQSLGFTLGTASAPKLSNGLGDRSLAIGCSVASIAGMLGCALAIRAGSIYLYTLSKFVVSFAVNGILFSLMQTLHHQLPDAATREATGNSITAGTISAAVVSALLGGYIAHYLSYSFIYVLGAAMCAFLILLSAKGFVRLRADAQNAGRYKADPVPGKRYLAFFFRGPGFAYLLFYLLPYVVVSGYKSYLFPMYTAGAGISALLLSNLAVFASTFSLIVQDSVRNLFFKLGTVKRMVLPCLIVSAGLILFFISPNVYWAIIMLFIYEVLAYVPNNAEWAYESELAEESGLDAKSVQANALSWKARMNVLQSPILSAAASLGMNYACAVVGAVASAMYFIFGFLNRNRGKKDETR